MSDFNEVENGINEVVYGDCSLQFCDDVQNIDPRDASAVKIRILFGLPEGAVITLMSQDSRKTTIFPCPEGNFSVQSYVTYDVRYISGPPIIRAAPAAPLPVASFRSARVPLSRLWGRL